MDKYCISCSATLGIACLVGTTSRAQHASVAPAQVRHAAPTQAAWRSAGLGRRQRRAAGAAGDDNPAGVRGTGGVCLGNTGVQTGRAHCGGRMGQRRGGCGASRTTKEVIPSAQRLRIGKEYWQKGDGPLTGPMPMLQRAIYCSHPIQCAGPFLGDFCTRLFCAIGAKLLQIRVQSFLSVSFRPA